MTTKTSADLATVSDITPTPYIAVAANYFGTGMSAKAARLALVKAGGSSDEEQTIFKLPEGAVGAYVSSKGDIHWGGVEGETQPVYRYVGGKSVALGDAKPVAYKKPTTKTAPRHSPRAQDLGEIFPEPQLDAGPPTDDKSSTIATITPDVAADKPKRARRTKPGSLPKFMVGDKVEWTSGPMANRVTKVGDVTHVIPVGGLPEAGLLRGTDGRDGGRSVESYIVRSGNRNYWPHTSALTAVFMTAAGPADNPNIPSTPVQAETTPHLEEMREMLQAHVDAPTVTEAQPVTADAAPTKPATKPSKSVLRCPECNGFNVTKTKSVAGTKVICEDCGYSTLTPPGKLAPNTAKAQTEEHIAKLATGTAAQFKAEEAAAAPVAKPAKVKVTTAPKVKAPKAEPKAIEAADFLLFVGSSFYDKDTFIKECDTLGISRRMPSHRLPKGLVAGQSRVYVAAEGVRKTDGTPMTEVFGYFTPERVEFICTSLESADMHADIIAAVKARGDIQIVQNISQEAPRECGTRQEGGTYIVVDKGTSPLKLLDKPAHYVGNHFRGMLKLSDVQVKTFNIGGTVETLVDEVCMGCGAAMKCAPDGHIRAERERKRIDKGDLPKWRLNCGLCQAKVRADRKAAGEVVDGDAIEATEADGESVQGDDDNGEGETPIE